MTASSSTVSIVNRALLGIGARATIASLDEGSTESDAASILFLSTFSMLARSAPWNCLRQQAVLSLIAAAQGTPENPDGATLPLPPSPWLYQYQEPSDCLQIRFLVPSFPNSAPAGTSPLTSVNNNAATWLANDGSINFVVAYATDANNNPISTVLTNLTQAQAVYTVNQPNPVAWDSMFEQAMVSSLGAFLVPALSLNIPLMQMATKAADAMIAQARVRDGDEGNVVQDHLPDFISARSAGSMVFGWSGLSPSVFANTWYDMAWPGYG